MSLKGKYTNIDSIIERVHREGLHDFTKEEASEWIWEGISLLGVPKYYVDKVAIIKVENGRAVLPYDLSDFSEGLIREYYSKAILLEEKNMFKSPSNNSTINNTNLWSFEGESIVYDNGVQIDGEGFLIKIPEPYHYAPNDLTYKINDGFIFTGFNEGIIEMAYKAFPVDNDGMPMVEDSAKTIRFIVAFINKKVATRMWLADEIQDKKKSYFDSQYSYAASAARSDANLGSLDDWEAIRSRINRLYRDSNLAKVGFEGYSNREQINLE